jgi:hypothetical protein
MKGKEFSNKCTREPARSKRAKKEYQEGKIKIQADKTGSPSILQRSKTSGIEVWYVSPRKKRKKVEHS